MATYTSYMNLKKPAYSDTADIQDINNNSDLIDAAVKKQNFYCGAVVPADAYGLPTEIATNVNSNFPLSTLPIGSVIEGSGSWTNVYEFDYKLTKRGSSTVDVMITNGSRIIMAAISISTLQPTAYGVTMLRNDTDAIESVDGTAPKAVYEGQFIKHNGILRIATMNIASGTAITNSNSIAVSDGGFNALNDKFSMAVSRGTAPLITTSTNNSNFSISSGEYFVVVDGSNDGTYKATSAIPIGATWSDKSSVASLKGGLNVFDGLISNTLTGSYASRTALAEAVWGMMTDNTIKIGRAGVTGVSNYLFLAIRSSSNNSSILLMSASNVIRLITKFSGTISEYSLTGS